MATFESMDRRMPKIEACLKATAWSLWTLATRCSSLRASTATRSCAACSPSALITLSGHTPGHRHRRQARPDRRCRVCCCHRRRSGSIHHPGSVAEQRQVGLGHGNLGARLLSEDTTCFAFLAGHESFAAAEGAIGIARTANKVRKTPLRVILNGLGKDAAYIISRINGFTYVQTEYDIPTQTLTVVKEIPFSEGERAAVKCYGANE